MEHRSRSAESVILWLVTLLLGATFAVTGVAKIVGAEPVGLQAAAMRGFPEWVRIIVGIVEVAGAIALFVAPVAAFAAVMLAFLMVPATITQWISGEPGVFVPLVLLVLLVVVAWRRDPAAARAGYDALWKTPRPLVRQGVLAGVIGATVIAAWFFVIDLVAGRALFTPLSLGRGLLTAFTGAAPESTALTVLAYTVVHYAAFVALGLVAVAIVDAANREPSILMGFVVLFAAMEVGFYAFVGLLQHATPLGSLAWYNVMAGNVLALAAMGTYLLRAHPKLRQQFRHSMDAPLPPHGAARM